MFTKEIVYHIYPGLSHTPWYECQASGYSSWSTGTKVVWERTTEDRFVSIWNEHWNLPHKPQPSGNRKRPRALADDPTAVWWLANPEIPCCLCMPTVQTQGFPTANLINKQDFPHLSFDPCGSKGNAVVSKNKGPCCLAHARELQLHGLQLSWHQRGLCCWREREEKASLSENSETLIRVISPSLLSF